MTEYTPNQYLRRTVELQAECKQLREVNAELLEALQTCKTNSLAVDDADRTTLRIALYTINQIADEAIAKATA